MTDNYKHILIIKPSSLGDIVLALPALSALKRSFPRAKISWLIRPEFAPLIENHPHLDNIITFNRKILGKAWYNIGAFEEFLSLVGQLRRNRFDLVIDFQGLLRTAFFSWISGCKKRFGMANAREFSRFFYTHTIRQESDCIHLVDYYLRIVRQAGTLDTAVEFILPADKNAREKVDLQLKKDGANPNNYAVLVPGSNHKNKCWPIENFSVLAEKISEKFGFSLVATGTDIEKDIIEKLKTLTKVPIANLAGKTSIRELIALQRAARLVVSNDTGPGHIAAASGVPIVMIFGPTNPARVAPYKRNYGTVAVDGDSRGYKPYSPDPKYDIKSITVEQVYQNICRQLKPRA